MTDIDEPQRMNPTDYDDLLTTWDNLEVHICGFEWNISTTTGWIAKQKMNQDEL